MKVCSVIDVGFGDSGKGLTTDWLAGQNPGSSLVIRFGGGHQVGHTVVRDGFEHTFSNFGSGSLCGVPTWYSPTCVAFLPGLVAEARALSSFGPKNYYHPLVKLTSPYDIAFNRAQERYHAHGSCGLGFGATIERNQSGPSLYLKDLASPWVFRQRLDAIRFWYEARVDEDDKGDRVSRDLWYDESSKLSLEAYIEQCYASQVFWQVSGLDDLIGSRKSEDLIFEGHQGILLDQDHGIYPHLTWSCTTSKGVCDVLADHLAPWTKIEELETYFVTRSYQTRHGIGPMSHEFEPGHVFNANEANKTNDWQGHFRIGEFDGDLVSYAIRSDLSDFNIHKFYREHGHSLPTKRNLVVTCLDQRSEIEPKTLVSKIDFNFDSVFGSYGPSSETLRVTS